MGKITKLNVEGKYLFHLKLIVCCLVKEAKDLASNHKSGKSDPFVVVVLGAKKKKTKVKKATSNPKWNEVITL
jgi:Ca2+-dependent lipid-binding protein